jgi:tyrosine-protein phosphatase
MTFPKVLERNESGLSEVLRPMKLSVPGPCNSTIVEEDSPIRIQVASRGAIDNDQLRDESENNEDQKSPGYPEGPIAIYEDNVYLYLEPTAEEAATFDVVINVAREVKNPFHALAKSETASAEETQLVGDDSPMRDAALPAGTVAVAPELPQGEEPAAETPTTPKASFAPKLPEYIHMPWDHNTNIAVDLMSLCETIDKRTKEGKKVLIHCQQGASRSASLIIAYGLYRNPELSVNDAYYAAQGKSRWISPNMKLMYCLQDFQKELSKRKLTPASSAFRPRTGRSPSKHRLTLSADAIDIAPKEPRTAPLLSETDQGVNGKPEDGCLRQCSVTGPPSHAIAPGPSSAPSSFSWMEVDDARDLGKLGRFDLDRTPLVPKAAKVPAVKTEAKPIALNLFAKPPPTPGFAPHSFDSHSGFGFSGLSFGHTMSRPFQDDLPRERQITIASHFPDDSALMSPRAETMTNNPLRDAFGSGMGGMRFIESPPTPKEELFSPRTTMFPRDPFLPFGRPPQVADPRSPPTKGESPIVRSIDEIL